MGYDIKTVTSWIYEEGRERLPFGKHEFALICPRGKNGCMWAAVFGGADDRSPTTTGEGIYRGEGSTPDAAMANLLDNMRGNVTEAWWKLHLSAVDRESRRRATPLPLDAAFLTISSQNITASQIVARPNEPPVITADQISAKRGDGVITADQITATKVYGSPPPGWPEVRTYPPLPDGHDDLF